MKKFHALFACMLTASLLFACTGSSGPTAASDLKRERNPSVPVNGVNNLVDGNNTFALDLYQTLRTQNGNLILSPYSISLALAMTHAGARSETEAQMAQVMHFPPQAQLHPAFNALDLQLQKQPANPKKDQEPLQLNIANAVWAEQTFSFLPEYLNTLALNYGAGIRLSDFINKPEPTRKEINDWVNDQTKEKIQNLLPEGTVNPDTRMVLVNAIYFKADWLDQFDANDTRDLPFTLLDGSKVNAPMMRQEMRIPYTSGDGYQAIELPYAGNAAMEIIVPDEGRFEEIESALDYTMLSEILAGLEQSTVILRLPKFEFESSFLLSDALAGMGMPAAFDRNAADFSGMTGKKDLFISDVVHKAFVAVDEEGTEAAAATAVIMEAAGAAMPEGIILVIDRPFVFLIRDLQSGQILFIGRVLDPQ